MSSMSKAAGGSESASKGPRRRQPRRGPDKLDILATDDAPGGFNNPIPGDVLPSRAARSSGKRRLDDAGAPPVPPLNLEAVLRKYMVCADLSIHNSLTNDPQIVLAIEKALKPRPKKMDGDDEAQEAEALSKIISCEHQARRATLVTELLARGVRSWPPPGCQFDLNRRPPLLAALEAHGTFRKEAEWDNMFDSLAAEGDMDEAWGPKRIRGDTEYYKLFNKSHWSSREE